MRCKSWRVIAGQDCRAVYSHSASITTLFGDIDPLFSLLRRIPKPALGIIIALIGGLFLAIGLSYSSSDDVMCGSRVMHPGDTCAETTAGQTTDTHSYDEMKKSNGTDSTLQTIVGGVLLAGGIGIAAWGFTHRKPKPAEADISASSNTPPTDN